MYFMFFAMLLEAGLLLAGVIAYDKLAVELAITKDELEYEKRKHTPWNKGLKGYKQPRKAKVDTGSRL